MNTCSQCDYFCPRQFSGCKPMAAVCCNPKVIQANPRGTIHKDDPVCAHATPRLPLGPILREEYRSLDLDELGQEVWGWRWEYRDTLTMIQEWMKT